MQQRLTDLQATILVGAFNDIRQLRGRGEPAGYGHDLERAAWADAIDGIARTSPGRWLGVDQSASDRVRFGRALKALERAALIERVVDLGGIVCTRVRLLPAGAELAEQLSEGVDA